MTLDELDSRIITLQANIDALKTDVDLIKQILVEVYDEPDNAIKVKAVEE